MFCNRETWAQFWVELSHKKMGLILSECPIFSMIWFILCLCFIKQIPMILNQFTYAGGALALGAFQEFNACIFVRKLSRGRIKKRKHCGCYYYLGREMSFSLFAHHMCSFSVGRGAHLSLLKYFKLPLYKSF